MIKRILILLAMLAFLLNKAACDCMDNSWHLQKKYDTKTYHLVNDCYCPCGKGPAYKILASRGKCLTCGHYRDPRPLTFSCKPQACLEDIPKQVDVHSFFTKILNKNRESNK